MAVHLKKVSQSVTVQLNVSFSSRESLRGGQMTDEKSECEMDITYKYQGGKNGKNSNVRELDLGWEGSGEKI